MPNISKYSFIFQNRNYKFFISLNDYSLFLNSVNHLFVNSIYGKIYLLYLKILFRLNLVNILKYFISLSNALIEEDIFNNFVKNTYHNRKSFFYFFLRKSARKRFYLFSVDSYGKLFFLKVAYSKKDQELLKKEYHIFMGLTKLLPDNMAFKILKNKEISNYSFNEYNLISNKLKNVNRWEGNLTKLWKSIIKIEFNEKYFSLNYSDKSWIVKFNKLLNNKTKDKMEISFVHGDFTPWNLKKDKLNTIYIFDFEYANFTGPILFDPYHYYLSYYSFIKKRKINIDDLLLFLYSLNPSKSFKANVLAAAFYETIVPNSISKSMSAKLFKSLMTRFDEYTFFT